MLLSWRATRTSRLPCPSVWKMQKDYAWGNFDLVVPRVTMKFTWSHLISCYLAVSWYSLKFPFILCLQGLIPFPFRLKTVRSSRISWRFYFIIVFLQCLILYKGWIMTFRTKSKGCEIYFCCFIHDYYSTNPPRAVHLFAMKIRDFKQAKNLPFRIFYPCLTQYLL